MRLIELQARVVINRLRARRSDTALLGEDSNHRLMPTVDVGDRSQIPVSVGNESVDSNVEGALGNVEIEDAGDGASGCVKAEDVELPSSSIYAFLRNSNGNNFFLGGEVSVPENFSS